MYQINGSADILDIKILPSGTFSLSARRPVNRPFYPQKRRRLGGVQGTEHRAHQASGKRPLSGIQNRGDEKKGCIAKEKDEDYEGEEWTERSGMGSWRTI